jgi:hypothetical protein
MDAVIIPFGLPRPVAQELINGLAVKGQFSIEPHAKDGMLRRSITMRQTIMTMQEGTINQGPEMDEYGDWRCRVRKRTAGRLVRVVVAIHDMRFLYVISVH